MSPLLVASCYGSATLLSLYLLWHFGAKHWYWHLLSLVLALVIGLTPMPGILTNQYLTLVVGWIFTFLFLWGAAAPIYAYRHLFTFRALGHR
ncbi:MAG TPA: hypothetical protein VFL57_19445 [Bryobacteraceae bacterium]|nr:hypothetical protein [Bryobacteraceae bacterium]